MKILKYIIFNEYDIKPAYYKYNQLKVDSSFKMQDLK